MNDTSFLKFAYLTLLSKPAHERVLYKKIRKTRPLTIVELGVGLGIRSANMIGVAKRYRPDEQIRYTGIDLFEARPDPMTGLQLKYAHRQLKATGARAQVVPGDPYSALARSANGLQQTDLLVISADQDQQSLDSAWFYVPRMLHNQSVVLIEGISSGQPQFRSLSVEQIDKLAANGASVRRAA